MADSPHDWCNWLIVDKVLVGSVPRKDSILTLSHVDLFVSLQDKQKPPWYENGVDANVVHYPCRAGRAIAYKTMTKLVRVVKDAIANQQLCYIHCDGGHGRAGMAAACIVGNINSLSCAQAVTYVENARLSRPNQSRHFVPTPETSMQVRLVAKFLNDSDAQDIPDRTDKQWLKQLRKLRKEERQAASTRYVVQSNDCSACKINITTKTIGKDGFLRCGVGKSRLCNSARVAMTSVNEKFADECAIVDSIQVDDVIPLHIKVDENGCASASYTKSLRESYQACIDNSTRSHKLDDGENVYYMKLPILVNVRVAHIRPQYDDLREWCNGETNVYIARAGVVFVKVDESAGSGDSDASVDKVLRYPKRAPYKKGEHADTLAEIIEDLRERYPKQSSIYANPYKKGKHADTLAEIIEMYNEKQFKPLRDTGVITDKMLLSLCGKNIGCWCTPKQCHGDVIVEAVHELLEQLQ